MDKFKEFLKTRHGKIITVFVVIFVLGLIAGNS